MSITKTRDTDFHMMSLLGSKDLEHLCQINTYFRSLCQEYQNMLLDKQDKIEILEIPNNILPQLLKTEYNFVATNIIVKQKNIGKFHRLTGYSGRPSILVFVDDEGHIEKMFVEDTPVARSSGTEAIFYPIEQMEYVIINPLLLISIRNGTEILDLKLN